MIGSGRRVTTGSSRTSIFGSRRRLRSTWLNSTLAGVKFHGGSIRTDRPNDRPQMTGGLDVPRDGKLTRTRDRNLHMDGPSRLGITELDLVLPRTLSKMVIRRFGTPIPPFAPTGQMLKVCPSHTSKEGGQIFRTPSTRDRRDGQRTNAIINFRIIRTTQEAKSVSSFSKTMNNRLLSLDLKRTDPTVISFVRLGSIAGNPKRFFNRRIFWIDSRDEETFRSTERNEFGGNIRLETQEGHKLRNALFVLLRPAGTKEVSHWLAGKRSQSFDDEGGGVRLGGI